MGALKKDVLLEALHIQSTLVSGSAGGLTDVKAPQTQEHGPSKDYCAMQDTGYVNWGFHSPLMFWNCSARHISRDLDPVETVNRQAGTKSYLNITLRLPSVFAGKRYDGDRLRNADAIVVTMFGQRSPENRRVWLRGVERLSSFVQARGHAIYPSDGRVLEEHFYEFRHQPVSTQDWMLLASAYLCVILYFVFSLRRLRALRSWAGLLFTVLFQIALSITAGFAICAWFRVDLAKIPEAALPFVVMTMGLENMFRLIDAVISQKPELSPPHRVAMALSEVGHLSLTNAAQMLLILSCLAKLAPAMSAFCVFAAIALVFDFALHLTFFVAVLSVDVRRVVLQESILRVENSSAAKKQYAHRQERLYWVNALLQGRLPRNSRIAGSAISIVFMLALNTHFYDANDTREALLQSLKSMIWPKEPPAHNSRFSLPNINQARTPEQWLSIQSYRHGQEILRYVKPHGNVILALVYNPLIVVLHGSNRSGPEIQPQSFLSALLVGLQKHLYPFVLTMIFVVALVTILLQYLLWNELPEEDLEDDELGPSTPLSVETLPISHRLDILHLTACPNGSLVSVSLDRVISFCVFDARAHSYSISTALSTALPWPLWPIVSVTLDKSGSWAALCGLGGRILVWDMEERRQSHTFCIDLCEHPPILFTLSETNREDGLSLITVTADGRVAVVDPLREGEVKYFGISKEKLASASISRARSHTTLIALTKSGKIRLATYGKRRWTTVDEMDPRLTEVEAEGMIKSLAVCLVLDVLAAPRLRVVELVDLRTSSVIHSFPALRVGVAGKLRILTSRVCTCRTCNVATAVHSISLAYTDSETESLVIRTYTIRGEENVPICLGPQSGGKTPACPSLAIAKEEVHVLEDPGTWDATNEQSIIGLRRKPYHAGRRLSTVLEKSSGSEAPQSRWQRSDSVRLRGVGQTGRRFSNFIRLEKSSHDEQNEWEAWTLSIHGELRTEPLRSSAGDESDRLVGEDDLLVASPGPMTRLGQRSVAVGFGNRVKILSLGREKFAEEPAELADGFGLGKARRRKTARRKGFGSENVYRSG